MVDISRFVWDKDLKQRIEDICYPTIRLIDFCSSYNRRVKGDGLPMQLTFILSRQSGDYPAKKSH